jgi:hypothetical protein
LMIGTEHVSMTMCARSSYHDHRRHSPLVADPETNFPYPVPPSYLISTIELTPQIRNDSAYT